MRKFLQLNEKERELLFHTVGDENKISSSILEKDFWVTWTLQYLFHEFPYQNQIVFKGGTCLSKVYGIIDRFSEDIDLAMDWSLLNIDTSTAYEERSNRQQEFFNKAANEKTAEYLKAEWLPRMRKDFSDRLGDKFDLYIENDDPQTIIFRYPRFFSDPSILQNIRLEIGTLAEPIPSEYRPINPIIKKYLPILFDEGDILVNSVSTHRTFFEKITILHREACRTNGHYPKRYSRHYYDVYQLIKKGVGDDSLTHLDILQKVIDFKRKFYPCKWAEYDKVMKGRCCLVGNEEAMKVYRNDYLIMQSMIYGNSPDFDTILLCLNDFEMKLNSAILECKLLHV